MSNKTLSTRQGAQVDIVSRIRPMREAEGMSRDEFARETGLKFQSVTNYELGRNKSIGSEQLEKITNHPRFQKYALWLVTGNTAPEAGQISPEIEVARDTG